jgi:hypothetical protein
MRREILSHGFLFFLSTQPAAESFWFGLQTNRAHPDSAHRQAVGGLIR